MNIQIRRNIESDIRLDSKALFNRFFTPSNPSSRYIGMDARYHWSKSCCNVCHGKVIHWKLNWKDGIEHPKGDGNGVNQFEEENR